MNDPTPFPRTRFVAPGRDISLGMVGMVEGNGHPYSWSAIVNGYDQQEMVRCPYPLISRYLDARPDAVHGMDGVRVTHIWTDCPEDAVQVARSTHIRHVVGRPEDMIGEVDAVMIATDDGHSRIHRLKPFVDNGIPIFVDKPLSTRQLELEQIIEWFKGGHFLMSSSATRYSPEFHALRAETKMLGDLRWVTSTSIKKWDTYAIHALEAAFLITGPGYVEVSAREVGEITIANYLHNSGCAISISLLRQAVASFAVMHAYGEGGHCTMQFTDTYAAFRNQIASFIEAIRNAAHPYPFTESVELMRMVIAGKESMDCDGQAIAIT